MRSKGGRNRAGAYAQSVWVNVGSKSLVKFIGGGDRTAKGMGRARRRAIQEDSHADEINGKLACDGRGDGGFIDAQSGRRGGRYPIKQGAAMFGDHEDTSPLYENPVSP